MALEAAQYDFEIQRGNFGNMAEVRVGMQGLDGSKTDLTLAQVTLTVTNKVRLFTKKTADNSLTIDTDAGTVSWFPTEQEVNQIPLGRYATYTLDVAFPDGSGARILKGFMVGKA